MPVVLLAGVGGLLPFFFFSLLRRSLFISLGLAVRPGLGAPLKLPHLLVVDLGVLVWV